MNRFLLFVFGHYYPSGGWNNFIASFCDRSLAQDRADSILKNTESYNRDEAHIVDLDTGQVLYKVREGEQYSDWLLTSKDAYIQADERNKLANLDSLAPRFRKEFEERMRKEGKL